MDRELNTNSPQYVGKLFLSIGSIDIRIYFFLVDFLAYIIVTLALIFLIYYDMSRVVTKLTIRKIKNPAYVMQEQN